MAFKEVQSLDAETTISLGGFNKKTRQDNPTQVEGYYLGSKTVPSQKSKTGKAFLHVFQTADGNVGVWGKTDLDRKMGALADKLGVMVRVTQKGTKPTKGGNDMYMFRVEVDVENMIEVAAPQQTLEAEETSDYGDSTEEMYDTEESYDEDLQNDAAVIPRRPTAPVKAATVPDAARQAKVKALLAKTKTA
jgi:hypothetical protein